MTDPLVSIVIPSYNGRTYLEPCLAALTESLRDDAEVIVVDNGSTDGTEAFLQARYPRIRVVEAGTNRGFAGACNLGAQQARGTWLVFLNNDTLPDPGWLEALLAAGQRDARLGACTSKIRIMSARDRLDAVGSFLTPLGFLRHVGLLELDHGQYDSLGEIFSPKGVCFLVRRPLFVELGGFDETFFAYFEETDLFWRVWLRGFRIGFAPQSVVYHKIGGTSSRLSYAFVDFHSFKNRIRTLLKNLGLGALCWMLPVHLVCCAGLAVLSALKGRWANAWAIIRAVGWNLRHLGGTWQARRAVQQNRRISDAELFRHALQPVPLKEFARYTYWTVVSREAMRADIYAGKSPVNSSTRS